MSQLNATQRANFSAESDTEPLQKDPNRHADMRWLIHFVMGHRGAAIGSIVTGMIGGITLALEPYLMGIIIDNIRNGVEIEQLTRDILVLFALAIVTVIAFWGQRHYSGIVAYAVHYDIRKTVFDNMVKLDYSFYTRYATGDLISRMFSDLNWVWRLLALTFNRLGNALIAVILAFFLLATVNVTLALIVFVVISISTAIQIRAGLFLVPISERVQDQQGNMTALVQDAVSGIQTVKTFGRETGVNAAFWDENVEYRRKWLFYKRVNEPVGMIPQMIIQLTTGLVVLLGGWMTISGEITLGNFAQFLLYLNLIRRSLLMLGTMYQRYVQTQGALRRISPLLQETGIKSAPNAQPLPDPQGNITFENVTYKVGDKTLLHDISFDIKGGTTVGLVGPTGSGKTVLVNLLARVSDIAEGSVKVDNMDVRDIDLVDLREAIAYVPQTTFLFSQPLHENIRMGRPHITDEEIDRAVEISRMSNDLPQLPDGMETLVGEKGVLLSGGQKQRVAIARAVVRNPAILILDDALSSVDTQTAADILSDMRDVMETRTSIIIAHRMATVKDADLIIVMDEGRIVEQGTHNALVEKGGLYASMVERELKQEQEELLD